MRPGWPVAIPKVHPRCGDVGPYLGPDGTVYVMAGDALHAFTRAGRRKAGWPFVPAAGFSGHPCVADAPGPPAPAFAGDATVYVPTWVDAPDADGPGRAGISAVDARGRMVPGWPIVMGAPVWGGLGATGLGVAAGRLYATLYGTCSGTASLVALEPDGSIAR